MATLLNPYLMFTDEARAALEFYADVFGGTPTLNAYGDFGGEMAPESHADKIMHGMLMTDRGLALMAADAPPGQERLSGNDVGLSLSGDDADDLRGYWEKLSAGGTVTVPLEKQMWGDEFGECVDRFGVRWLVNITAA